MDEVWQDCLFPVLLGSNTVCHACVRRFEKRLGLASTVLTGKRALTLRFLPAVRLLYAPPTLQDALLLAMLEDLSVESGLRVPLLVICDGAYSDFIARHREELEARFILRDGAEILGEGDRI